MKSVFPLLVVALLSPVIFGCGGKENTIVTPGEDYQLNEQEQAYKDAENKLRSDGN